MTIPRLTFEQNARMGVTKKGTDVQVSPERFKELLAFYRKFSQLGIPYNLFGHFGDAHLHFNFMPKPEEETTCQSELEALYETVRSWDGSPFAEHGIGIIKQKFISSYLEPIHFEMFKLLKSKLDPKKVLFPQGFMTMGERV